jgi:hypothetical protein
MNPKTAIPVAERGTRFDIAGFGINGRRGSAGIVNSLRVRGRRGFCEFRGFVCSGFADLDSTGGLHAGKDSRVSEQIPKSFF